jgi:hypothetical protein
MKPHESPEAIAWFEAYAKRSNTTVEALRALGYDVRKCGPDEGCNYEDCQGWQKVNVETYNSEPWHFIDGEPTSNVR